VVYRWARAIAQPLRVDTAPLYSGNFRKYALYIEGNLLRIPGGGISALVLNTYLTLDMVRSTLVMMACPQLLYGPIVMIFLIHGSTYQKTVDALKDFLDLTVRVGLLCHPGKHTTPAHVVKYTGLLFDTTDVPTLRIPEYKRAEAIAMTDFALLHRRRLSRLGLAVVVGVLESLVEATPSRLGHTHLRNVQEILHPSGWDGPELPYYSFAELTDKVCSDLKMWCCILERDDGRRARGGRSGTLVPTFGDGSGTGTGGTVQYVKGKPFQMWLGTWHPRVFHFSANWKEMRTLLATLERAKAEQRDVDGVTFFYFTDSSTVYLAVSKGSSSSPSLHDMVVKIKQLEIELGCHLEVVHAPGTTIITEQTDGLSHGIWISAPHPRPMQARLLSEIFSPVVTCPDVQQWAMNQAGFDPHTVCCHRNWDVHWDATYVMNHLTIWNPPPEVGAQLLSFLLQCHVERPLTTASLTLLPRVIRKKWSRPSRLIVEVGAYRREEVPLVHRSFLTIPIVLLLIPYHVYSYPDPRLDTVTPSPLRIFHRQQAALVRGVLDALDGG
jgi:hypothetical protein